MVTLYLGLMKWKIRHTTTFEIHIFVMWVDNRLEKAMFGKIERNKTAAKMDGWDQIVTRGRSWLSIFFHTVILSLAQLDDIWLMIDVFIFCSSWLAAQLYYILFQYPDNVCLSGWSVPALTFPDKFTDPSLRSQTSLLFYLSFWNGTGTTGSNNVVK